MCSGMFEPGLRTSWSGNRGSSRIVGEASRSEGDSEGKGVVEGVSLKYWTCNVSLKSGIVPPSISSMTIERVRLAAAWRRGSLLRG